MQAINKENQNVYLPKYNDLVNQIKVLKREKISLQNEKKILEATIYSQNITIFKYIGSSYKALRNKKPVKYSKLCNKIATLKSELKQNNEKHKTTTDELQYKNDVLNKTLSELEKLTASEVYKAFIIDQYALAPDETSPNRENLIENSTVKKVQGMTYGPRKTNRPKTDIKKKQPKTTRCMPTCIIS